MIYFLLGTTALIFLLLMFATKQHLPTMALLTIVIIVANSLNQYHKNENPSIQAHSPVVRRIFSAYPMERLIRDQINILQLLRLNLQRNTHAIIHVKGIPHQRWSVVLSTLSALDQRSIGLLECHPHQLKEFARSQKDPLQIYILLTSVSEDEIMEAYTSLNVTIIIHDDFYEVSKLKNVVTLVPFTDDYSELLSDEMLAHPKVKRCIEFRTITYEIYIRGSEMSGICMNPVSLSPGVECIRRLLSSAIDRIPLGRASDCIDLKGSIPRGVLISDNLVGLRRDEYWSGRVPEEL